MRAALALTAALMLAGCITDIEPQDHTIRPSPVRLASFDSYGLQPLAVERMEGDSGDQAAVAQIDTELRGCVRRELRALREEPAGRATAGRSLMVEPVIVALKKVNRTERRWVGPFAGSSAVLLRLTLRDAQSRATIADPVFYARADAWRGSFAPFAATDEAMLSRVVEEACGYVRQNM